MRVLGGSFFAQRRHDSFGVGAEAGRVFGGGIVALADIAAVGGGGLADGSTHLRVAPGVARTGSFAQAHEVMQHEHLPVAAWP